MRYAITILILVFMVAVGVLAQKPFSVHEDAGANLYFSLTTNVPTALAAMTYTNAPTANAAGAEYLAYPWKIEGLQVWSSGITGTATVRVDRVRTIKKNLYTGGVLVTNDFSEVETNYYWGVTGTVTLACMTNTLLSETRAYTNGVNFKCDDFADAYFLGGDVLVVTVNPTNTTRWIMLDTIR